MKRHDMRLLVLGLPFFQLQALQPLSVLPEDTGDEFEGNPPDGR
jgi:hypothetical protein